MDRLQYIIDKLSVRGSVYGIDTMCRLLEALGHPEEGLRIVHTAGTNGKGSTLAFLSGILTSSGYRVGRYISPTISCYEERFQINGQYIPKERLLPYFEKIDQVYENMKEQNLPTPTIFEAETALALMYFKDERVDYALIECGMGGLTDATNAISNPMLTLITSISEDHKGFLGDSLEKIAQQKAGIIKKCAPVILADNCEDVKKVIIDTCRNESTNCILISRNDLTIIEEKPTGNTFAYKGDTYEIPLAGKHQIFNAITAVEAALALKKMNQDNKISSQTIKNGLASVSWPGRLELLKDKPPFYLDGAHNPDGAHKLADFLEKHFTNKKIVYIMGVLGDKEYNIMLSYLMPLASSAYVFTPNNARGLEACILGDAMKPYGIPVTVCEDVAEAVRKALKEESDADCYVLCGSLSFIEEMRRKIFHNEDRKL